MNKVEKYATMVVAVVGAVTGGMATYTDFSGSEFKKPIDLRQATVASFVAQIESATKRGDRKEALRVRLDYERFEESWRRSQKLSSLTAQVENLISLDLAPAQLSQISDILQDAGTSMAVDYFKPETLGSAYLATGDYQSASKYYRLAELRSPDNPKVYALRALALQGEAQSSEVGQIVKAALEQEAKELVLKAESKGVDPERIQILSNELSKEG